MSVISELIYDLKYQYPNGVTTYSNCTNHHKCGKTARGGRACPDCIEIAIGAYIGRLAASELREAVWSLREAESEVYRIYHERLADGDIV